MKIYLQMYKYIFKSIPKISISFILMMVSVTIYKFQFLQPGAALFSTKDITIAQIIFRIVFTLLVIGSYGLVFGFMRGRINLDIFLMVPKIRTKTLAFSFLILLIIYIWAVFILGVLDSQSLVLFTMLNLWFLSICMSLYFFDIISIYQSNKYWFFKIFFLVFSFSAPLVSVKDPMKRPVLYFAIIGVFLVVVFYQLINFLNNYINLNIKNDFRTVGLGKKADSLQNIIDNFYVNKNRATLSKLKKVKLSKRYFKLFNITLFGPIFTYPWLCIGAGFSITYIHFIQEWSLKTLTITFIVYFGFLALVNTPKFFKQKNKIEFLFVCSGLSRIEFEIVYLKVTIRRFLTRLLKSIPSALLIILGNNFLFNPVKIYPLGIYIISFTIFNCCIIYLSWKSILRNKDYDKIKKAKVMRT